MATRMRDRIRLAEQEEEGGAVENAIPEEDTVYEDWSESELGDVRSQ